MTALTPDPRVLADDAIAVDLVVPDTRVGIGPLKVDLLERFTGVRLDAHLRPLLRAPWTSRSTPQGGQVLVDPLGIPDGEGLSLPLPIVGDVGFRNYRGFLVLIVPGGLAGEVERPLGDLIEKRLANGPRPARGTDGAVVSEFAVVPRPGMRKSFSIGSFGEFAVEFRG